MRRWLGCLLWSLLLLPPIRALTAYEIDETDLGILWNPPTICGQPCLDNWGIKTDSSYRGGSVRTAAKANLSASFTFRGSEVYWYSTTYPQAGTVKVVVDSDNPTVVILSDQSTQYRRQLFSRLGLQETEQHRITITTLDSKNVDIDYFVVMAPAGQTPVTPLTGAQTTMPATLTPTHPGIIAAISIGSTFGVVALGAFFVLLALLVHQHRVLKAESPPLSMGSSSGRRQHPTAMSASSSDVRARWHNGSAVVDADAVYPGHGASSHSVAAGAATRRHANPSGSSAPYEQPSLRADDIARIAEIVAQHSNANYPSAAHIPQATFLRPEDLAHITELVSQHSAVASSVSLPVRHAHPLAQSYPPVPSSHQRPPRAHGPPGGIRGGALAPPRTGARAGDGGYNSSSDESRGRGPHIAPISPEDLAKIADMVAERLREPPRPHERRR